MTTHNPMNDSTASGQLSWQEPEGLALLGIPISKEAQQIALVFASEQRNVKKGKQVFLVNEIINQLQDQLMYLVIMV
jgi:hypothetical protein